MKKREIKTVQNKMVAKQYQMIIYKSIVNFHMCKESFCWKREKRKRKFCWEITKYRDWDMWRCCWKKNDKKVNGNKVKKTKNQLQSAGSFTRNRYKQIAVEIIYINSVVNKTSPDVH